MISKSIGCLISTKTLTNTNCNGAHSNYIDIRRLSISRRTGWETNKSAGERQIHRIVWPRYNVCVNAINDKRITLQAVKVRSSASSQKERKGKTGEKKGSKEWSDVSRSAKSRRFVRLSGQPATKPTWGQWLTSRRFSRRNTLLQIWFHPFDRMFIHVGIRILIQIRTSSNCSWEYFFVNWHCVESDR